MKVEILKDTIALRQHQEAGAIIDVEPAEAQKLFDAGKAKPTTKGAKKISASKAATIDNRDPKVSK